MSLIILLVQEMMGGAAVTELLWDSDEGGGEMGTAASTVAVNSDNGSLQEMAGRPPPLLSEQTDRLLLVLKQLKESNEDCGVGMPGLNEGDGGSSVVK